MAIIEDHRPVARNACMQTSQNLRHVASSLPCKSTVMKSNVTASLATKILCSVALDDLTLRLSDCLAPLSSASIVVTKRLARKNCGQVAAGRTNLQSRTPRISARSRADPSCAVRCIDQPGAPLSTKIASPNEIGPSQEAPCCKINAFRRTGAGNADCPLKRAPKW